MTMSNVRKLGYVLTMVVTLLAMQTIASACAWDDCCPCCPCCQPGCGTPGYWVNHPEAWPVDCITLTNLEVVTYTEEECLYWMGLPVKGDKTLTLFPAYVAAVLNVELGNCDCCIIEVLEEAEEWLIEYPPGSCVPASSCAWQCEGECLYEWLDAYNNGLLCAPSRDSVEYAD
jgi:hypothetical protein